MDIAAISDCRSPFFLILLLLFILLYRTLHQYSDDAIRRKPIVLLAAVFMS